MAELVYRDLKLKGIDPFTSKAVYDVTQGYTFHSLRTDGSIPVVSRTSKIVHFAKAEFLSTRQLFALMGFPSLVAESALEQFSDVECMNLLGNTLHPAVAGVCSFSLLCLTADSR